MGEIELEDNVLVIRRTHLRLTFEAEEAHPEAASRPSIPHFVDSEERTLGVDPRALREYLTGTTELRDGVCVNQRTGRAIRILF